MPKTTHEPSAPVIVRTLRKKYGYTQEEIASWIGVHRTNYSRKEKIKDGVTLTANEFLLIITELKKRGPKQKNENVKFSEILDDLILIK